MFMQRGLLQNLLLFSSMLCDYMRLVRPESSYKKIKRKNSEQYRHQIRLSSQSVAMHACVQTYETNEIDF